MFSKCFKLKEIKLKLKKDNKVIYMYSMFQECKGLKSLDLSNFYTKNVTEIHNIFKDCKCDLIFKYYTLRGCDELVLDKKENEKLKQNDDIFQMETRFIEEIIKDKNNKNLTGKFGEFCKTTCHPHILRFSIHYR